MGVKRDSTDGKVWEYWDTFKSEQSVCPCSLDARLYVTNCQDQKVLCVCGVRKYIHIYKRVRRERGRERWKCI
jgi:hypothetical protein